MPATVDTSALERELRGIGNRASDFSAVTPALGEIILGYVNDEWDSAGRGRWPGLAPSTLRKRRGTSAQILKDTGRAAASPYVDAGNDYAAVWTDVEYMVFHAGDNARIVRDPFDVEDVAMPDLEDMIARYIAGET